MSISLIGEITLSNVLDWMVTWLLSCILALNIVQMGGVRAETQLISTWLVALLLVLHGLWAIATPERKGFALRTRALWFVPFLAYGLLQWLVLSPTPWAARMELIVLLQAFILFWIALNNMRTRQQVWFLFGFICVVVSLTTLIAFNQVLRRPDWLPKLINPLDASSFRLKVDPTLAGKGVGSMGTPANFAGLMLLVIGPLAVSAFSKRFSVVIRILCAILLGLCIAGITLTQSLYASLALTVVLLVSPFVLTIKPRLRTLGVFLAVLAAIIVVGANYITRDDFGQTVDTLLSGKMIDKRPVIWKAALSNTLQHPIMGQGMASFQETFESIRPEGFNLEPKYVHSEYLQFLSDFGLLGLIVLGFPAAYAVLSCFKAWRSQQQYVLLEHPKRMKMTPTKRMFLAGVLLAFLGLGINAAFEYNLHVPALLYIAAVFLGIGLKCLPAQYLPLHRSKLSCILLLATCGVAGIALIVFSQGPLAAQVYLSEGERRLAAQVDAINNRTGLELESLEDTVTILDFALEHQQNNPAIWLAMAQAHLDFHYITPSQDKAHGKAAAEYADKAIALYENDPQAWITLGTADWLQQDFDACGKAYYRATEIAPNNAQAWYYLAAYLNLSQHTHEEARAAIVRSLSLDPDSEQAQALKTKIDIPR